MIETEHFRPDEDFYIVAASSRTAEVTRVLKQGDTFAVFNEHGDIEKAGLGEEGVYHLGTRHLSRFRLALGDHQPFLLSSSVGLDNLVLAVHMTNTDVFDGPEIRLPRGTVHVLARKFLWNGSCYQHFVFRNHGLSPILTTVSFVFDADFADIFEVRGVRRRNRGYLSEPAKDLDQVVLAYAGLDRLVRRTLVDFHPTPSELRGKHARYDLELAPKAKMEIFVGISCETDESMRASPLSFENALRAARDKFQAGRNADSTIYTSNDQFNHSVNRAATDLHLMVTSTEHGPYPYAGIPWFSTAFGRDGILTALESLWLNPDLAKGVLRFLAAHQATEIDENSDAEPGKILHETRRGEMAALGEIPFGHYFGSVDSTPLFVLLAGQYHDHTGDRRLIEEIWPNILAALTWVDEYGDRDRDGFVEYYRKTPKGLANQGWKDSFDSIFHADGRLAEGPIALCEVQCYVHAARRVAARMAWNLGETDRARALERAAAELQERFVKQFWCEELQTYALALDGDKRPCQVRTSNAGHALFTGTASQEHAARLAATLLADDSFSGWGIRTVSALEVRYNPMSYHNGSVWPHDNALIAYGLARYGFTSEALRILTGLFDASLFMDLNRLPELFCGFERRTEEGPTLYPVACAPQAWASGAIFLALQACLGLSVSGAERTVRFYHPALPPFLKKVEINGLRAGQARIDLSVHEHPDDVGISILRREGDPEVVIIKR